MAKYLVVTDINEGEYKPGACVEFSPEEAKTMSWALAPASKEEAERAIVPKPVRRRYRVRIAFAHGGKKYEVGDVLELLETEASAYDPYLRRADLPRSG